MNAVEIKNVCKSYKKFKLDHVSLTLPSGSIIGLIGENGAGKSTLISLMTGAALCDSGSVEIFGTDNSSENFTQVKQDIGVVLDQQSFPDAFSAKNVNALMKQIYNNWHEDKFFGYIESFGIDRSQKFKNYSRGMRMKLPIAVALSHDARLLIMDEPTSGLDPVVRDEILDIIRDFTIDEDHSVIISSHILSDLEKICDYIAYLHKGVLKFCEEKDALCESMAVVTCSAEDIREIPDNNIIGMRRSDYGVEAMIKRKALIDGMRSRRASIEDIMLYTARGEQL